MAGILIIANAFNRAKVFIPIADKLSEMGVKVDFISLDPVLHARASTALKQSRHPFVEFPISTDDSIAYMEKRDRYRNLIRTKNYAGDLLDRIKPDLILLSAASYVEGVFIEESRKRKIKTALMQDGLRIEPDLSPQNKLIKRIVNIGCSLINEWTLALSGVPYYFAPFETNRVDKILLFGESQAEKMRKAGIHRDKLVAVGDPLLDNFSPVPKERAVKIREYFSLPPNRPVLLFGMQCFSEHKVIPPDDEVRIVQDLVDLFRKHEFVSLIIKLHPSNDIAMYRLHFNNWNPPANVYMVSDEFSPGELFAISSAFATVYSTLALESLLCNVPVLTLDYTKVPNRLDLTPAAVSIKSLDELGALITKENWVDSLKENMKKNRDLILDHELVNIGFASEKAAEELIKLIR